jgi:hypothetical protein
MRNRYVPILMAIIFARPVGNAVLQTIGVQKFGVKFFIAHVVAGVVIGVATVFVMLNLLPNDCQKSINFHYLDF